MGDQTVKSGTKPKKGKSVLLYLRHVFSVQKGHCILDGKAALLTERQRFPELSVLNTENKYTSGIDFQTNLLRL